MDNISSFAPFVEFVGAFCFAFVITDWSERLIKHFLNVEKIFKLAFDKIQSNIEADKVSIENMEPLVLEDRRSNENELLKLKNDYTRLFYDKFKVADSCSIHIKKFHQPHFTRQLFLMSGLYTVADILGMCLLDFFDSCSIAHIIVARFAVFNLLSVLFFIYFVIAEVLYWIKRGNVCQFWIPPFWKVIVVMVSIALSCVFIQFESWVNFDTAIVCVVLPVMPFIFCFILSLIMYQCSKAKVRRDNQTLIKRFELLHNRKSHLDKLYALFDKISFDFESDSN